jgi:putative oxidoreductase
MSHVQPIVATLAQDSTDGVDLGLLLLRIVIGLTVSAHGINKFVGGGKIPGTARWFTSMGMRPNGTVHAVLAACTETGGGLLFALGLVTPVAAMGIVGLMVVAAWTVHRPNGFFIVKDGFEYNLVLATVAVAVSMIGPGRYSIDRALEIDDDFVPKLALAISAGGGLLAAALLLGLCYRPDSVASAPATTSSTAPDGGHIDIDDVPVPGDHDADPGVAAAEEVPALHADVADAATEVHPDAPDDGASPPA